MKIKNIFLLYSVWCSMAYAEYQITLNLKPNCARIYMADDIMRELQTTGYPHRMYLFPNKNQQVFNSGVAVCQIFKYQGNSNGVNSNGDTINHDTGMAILNIGLKPSSTVEFTPYFKVNEGYYNDNGGNLREYVSYNMLNAKDPINEIGAFDSGKRLYRSTILDPLSGTSSNFIPNLVKVIGEEPDKVPTVTAGSTIVLHVKVGDIVGFLLPDKYIGVSVGSGNRPYTDCLDMYVGRVLDTPNFDTQNPLDPSGDYKNKNYDISDKFPGGALTSPVTFPELNCFFVKATNIRNGVCKFDLNLHKMLLEFKPSKVLSIEVNILPNPVL